MFSFLKSGDHVILHDSIYGGTINLVNTEFKKFNIDLDIFNLEINELPNFNFYIFGIALAYTILWMFNKSYSEEEE